MEARIGQSDRFAEYRAWIAQAWVEWRRLNGIPKSEVLTYAHYQAFDAWLQLRSLRSQLDPALMATARSAA